MASEPISQEEREERRSASYTRFIMALLVLTFFVLAFWNRMIIHIGAGQRGVLWRLTSGTDYSATYGEGTTLIFPWNDMTIYDTRVQEERRTETLMTQNGLEVTVELSYRWSTDEDRLPALHATFGPRYAEKFVLPEVVHAVREVLGNMTLDEVYRADEEKQILEPIQNRLRSRFQNYTPKETEEECSQRIHEACKQGDEEYRAECKECQGLDLLARRRCQADQVQQCLQADNYLCDQAIEATCRSEANALCATSFEAECLGESFKPHPSEIAECEKRYHTICVDQRFDECREVVLPSVPACRQQARPLVRCDVVIQALKTTDKVRLAIEDKIVTVQRDQMMVNVIHIEEQEARRKRIEAGGIRDFEQLARVPILGWRYVKAIEEIAKSSNAKIVFMGGGADRPPLYMDGGDVRPLVPAPTGTPTATPTAAPTAAPTTAPTASPAPEPTSPAPQVPIPQ